MQCQCKIHTLASPANLRFFLFVDPHTRLSILHRQQVANSCSLVLKYFKANIGNMWSLFSYLAVFIWQLYVS